MLRATVGLSLKRARLENVYSVLRGRDAKTGMDNPDKRIEQFIVDAGGPESRIKPRQLASLPKRAYTGWLPRREDDQFRDRHYLQLCAYLIGIRDYRNLANRKFDRL